MVSTGISCAVELFCAIILIVSSAVVVVVLFVSSAVVVIVFFVVVVFGSRVFGSSASSLSAMFMPYRLCISFFEVLVCHTSILQISFFVEFFVVSVS